MFIEFPTAVLEFSPGLLGLYGIWQCHDEAAPLLPVDMNVFCELHPEASNRTSQCDAEFRFLPCF
jgi:hypothetical protein